MLQLEATDISSVSTSNACRERFYIRIRLHLVSLDKSCICFSYHGCLGCNCSPDATSDIVYFLFTTSTLQHRAQVASILPNAIEVAIDPCIFTKLLAHYSNETACTVSLMRLSHAALCQNKRQRQTCRHSHLTSSKQLLYFRRHCFSSIASRQAWVMDNPGPTALAIDVSAPPPDIA